MHHKIHEVVYLLCYVLKHDNIQEFELGKADTQFNHFSQ